MIELEHEEQDSLKSEWQRTRWQSEEPGIDSVYCCEINYVTSRSFNVAFVK